MLQTTTSWLTAKSPNGDGPDLFGQDREASEAGLRPVRILVVEDEALIAFELRRLVTQLGYEVCALARSQPEAVRAADMHEPDLALMDIRLADNTDGVETAQELRNLFDIPVIYLTAHADAATLARAQATRPLGFVAKPFRTAKLETVLREAVASLRR